MHACSNVSGYYSAFFVTARVCVSSNYPELSCSPALSKDLSFRPTDEANVKVPLRDSKRAKRTSTRAGTEVQCCRAGPVRLGGFRHKIFHDSSGQARLRALVVVHNIVAAGLGFSAETTNCRVSNMIRVFGAPALVGLMSVITLTSLPACVPAATAVAALPFASR